MASLTYIPKAPSNREGPGKHLRQKQSHHGVPEQGDAEEKGEVGIAAEFPNHGNASWSHGGKTDPKTLG